MCRLVFAILYGFFIFGCHGKQKIDRAALVQRHCPVVTAADSLAVLSLGNGEFAFTADLTGLQTFPNYYDQGIPTLTMAHWGWHTTPNVNNYAPRDAMINYDHYGRQVGYATGQRTPAGTWLRANPHRLNLGRIGFVLRNDRGDAVEIQDVQKIHQSLDLWRGVLTSAFEIQGRPVQVTTVVHGDRDAVAVQVNSPLIQSGQLTIAFEFPYGSEAWGCNASDWTKPERHETNILRETDGHIDLQRILDADSYFVSISWNKEGTMKREARHRLVLVPGKGDTCEFTALFSKTMPATAVPTFAQTKQSAAAFWQSYWTEGGALDLSGSKDPRAHELERRIVLSQYLLAINSAGNLPPQETGLTCNSWYGKPHLEMHWWHGVQFVLWGRYKYLEQTLDWYKSIMPKAREMAEFQGYDGIRWPKMVGPDGREGPSSVGVFLIWQQPHPIYYAELMYRVHQDYETLEKYQELVFATAEFMASYAHYDDSEQRYVLGPPLIPAQESHPARTTMNPTFELAYWLWGLETAQKWCERLGLPRLPGWDRVIQNLSQLPVKDGLYVNAETDPNTFGVGGNRNDHPSLLAAYGMIPGSRVDPEIMRATLKKVRELWNWNSTWGWDFPLVAMTAARLHEPELAVAMLLMDTPRNRYLLNGHNYKDSNLPIYLPGNGSLLAAVAMMAAGWDGAPDRHAPGFPDDGDWTITWEKLVRLP